MPDYNYSIFKLNKLCSYSPEHRTEVCCFRLNLNLSKLFYYKLRKETNHLLCEYVHNSTERQSRRMRKIEMKLSSKMFKNSSTGDTADVMSHQDRILSDNVESWVPDHH